MTRRTRDELAATVAALETSLAEVAARLEEVEERAASLAAEKAEVDGEANLARRALVDFEERIAQQRQALAVAEKYEEACQTRDDAVRRRDAAGQRFAMVARELLDSLDELARARSAVAAAHDDLRHRFAGAAADISREPPEPAELREAWRALQQRLQVEKDLEEELLETAASSRYPMAADKLPPHLQEAARKRWTERRRGSQRR